MEANKEMDTFLEKWKKTMCEKKNKHIVLERIPGDFQNLLLCKCCGRVFLEEVK